MWGDEEEKEVKRRICWEKRRRREEEYRRGEVVRIEAGSRRAGREKGEKSR